MQTKAFSRRRTSRSIVKTEAWLKRGYQNDTVLRDALEASMEHLLALYAIFGRDKFTKRQFVSLEKILKNWKKLYPKAEILGHRDSVKTKKTCPNFDVREWLKNKKL